MRSLLAATVITLSGCLASSPPAPEANLDKKASAPAPVPALAAAAAKPTREVAKLKAPFAASDTDLNPALTVDSRCAAASSGGANTLKYAAGNCDNFGRPDGVAAAEIGRYTVVEGVYAAGSFVPGARYRVLTRIVERSRKDVLVCTDMRPSNYGASGSNPRITFSSTPPTVCKEYTGVQSSSGTQLSQSFVQTGEGQEGAIVVEGGTITVRSDVKLRAYHAHAPYPSAMKDFSMRNLVYAVEVVGIGAPKTETLIQSGSHEHRLKSGTIRRTYVNDVYVETGGVRQNRTSCLEGGGTNACVEIDDCTRDGPIRQHSGIKRGPSCVTSKVGRDILLSDGSVFTPLTKDGIRVINRHVLVEDPLPPGIKTYTLGDAFLLVLVEGKLKSKDGSEYVGNFVNGSPL